jgi:hypothetical protein
MPAPVADSAAASERSRRGRPPGVGDGQPARPVRNRGAARSTPSWLSELGDVNIYLVRLADGLGVDLVEAARVKLSESERRYDVETYRGSARKAPRCPDRVGRSE